MIDPAQFVLHEKSSLTTAQRLMAPKAKASSSGAEKANRTKKAGGCLASQMMADLLARQKQELKAQMKKLQKQKRSAQKAANRLKAKANKTALGDLMQIIVMKASQVCQELEHSEGGSSASTDAWVPTSPKDAFDKIAALLPDSERMEMESFAAALRDKAAQSHVAS